ncbi:hypothetical protein GCM10011391_27810 [Pullulanibacillus camelliae]|uniref:Uncharacterized protein n=1 Tax=Pullulanibacillus camelliae TaxID=1707096 RepID=A0A8J2YJR3_9BACL|nr:hypothetical protein [Pullulanibacillus camelliae]GGE47441.1 hypothetical protein GCM10011391_27810 [Pullulanibacillus camelliae]
MSIYLTKDEDNLIQNYVLLPLTIRVIENDLKQLETSKLKFKSPYRLLLEQTLKQLKDELRDTKTEVFKQNMRFYRKGELSYEAWVRGWEHKIIYHPSLASAWVENKIISLFPISHIPD